MDFQSFMTQSELLLRIVVACICGCIIGYERESRNKGAGIRTHAIVSLAAALIMIVSKYGFSDIPDYDASRVAAQIVSGIGFLGAGIIFVRNNSISGLTTAAGVWATAGIGMAVGSGLYYIGVITAFFIVLAQILLHQDVFTGKERKGEVVRLVLKNQSTGIDELKSVLSEEQIDIISVDWSQKENGKYDIKASVLFPAGYDRIGLMNLVSSGEGTISLGN